jgi:hypothetical protein
MADRAVPEPVRKRLLLLEFLLQLLEIGNNRPLQGRNVWPNETPRAPDVGRSKHPGTQITELLNQLDERAGYAKSVVNKSTDEFLEFVGNDASEGGDGVGVTNAIVSGKVKCAEWFEQMDEQVEDVVNR